MPPLGRELYIYTDVCAKVANHFGRLNGLGSATILKPDAKAKAAARAFSINRINSGPTGSVLHVFGGVFNLRVNGEMRHQEVTQANGQIAASAVIGCALFMIDVIKPGCLESGAEF